MKKTVAIIQTSQVSTKDIKALFEEMMPDVKLINIIDDSLIEEVKSNGHVTPFIVQRMCGYARNAQDVGADLILNQCSSVGEAADIMAQTVRIPVIKIDAAMAEQACRLGKRIAVVATVESTVAPSCRLVENTAKKLGAEVEVVPMLVDGAMDVLFSGDVKKHNEMVIGTVKKAAEECDVVVLAQGSMVVLLDELRDIGKPVLSSLRSGVESVKVALGL